MLVTLAVDGSESLHTITVESIRLYMYLCIWQFLTYTAKGTLIVSVSTQLIYLYSPFSFSFLFLTVILGCL